MTDPEPRLDSRILTGADDTRVLAAWTRYVPGVTAEEVDALLAIMHQHAGPLRRMVESYRAGTRRAPRDLRYVQVRIDDSHDLAGALGIEAGSISWEDMIQRVRELRG